MKNRRSYFLNFSTKSLLVVLKQRYHQFNKLKLKSNKSKNLEKELKELEFLIEVLKQELVNRYLKENISFIKCSKLFIASSGIEESIYKEIFMIRLLENSNNIISIDLLEEAIAKLDISNLKIIMCTKQGTIYEDLATKRYDEIIFDVSDEVYQDFLLKKELD